MAASRESKPSRAITAPKGRGPLPFYRRRGRCPHCGGVLRNAPQERFHCAECHCQFGVARNGTLRLKHRGKDCHPSDA